MLFWCGALDWCVCGTGGVSVVYPVNLSDFNRIVEALPNQTTGHRGDMSHALSDVPPIRGNIETSCNGANTLVINSPSGVHEQTPTQVHRTYHCLCALCVAFHHAIVQACCKANYLAAHRRYSHACYICSIWSEYPMNPWLRASFGVQTVATRR